MFKKKKFIIILLLLLVFIVLLLIAATTSRNSKKTPPQGNSSTQVIISDSQKNFFVELPANPSTGYQWQVDFDTKLIKLINTSFSQAVGKEVAGQEQVQTFEFQPLEKGKTSITFRYVRPWETSTPPSEVKNFEVTID